MTEIFALCMFMLREKQENQIVYLIGVIESFYVFLHVFLGLLLIESFEIIKGWYQI